MRQLFNLFSAAALVCGVSLSSLAQERDRPREGERDSPRDAERERPRDGQRNRPRDGDRGPEGRLGGPRGPGGFMRMMPVMAALDADADGSISAAEIENAVAALKALDKNTDGRLTEDELRPNVAGRPGAGPVGPGAPGEGRGPQEGRFGGPPSPEAFAERMLQGDEDKDGKLSRGELAKMAPQFGRGGAGGFGGGRGRPDGEGRGRPASEGGRPDRPE